MNSILKRNLTARDVNRLEQLATARKKEGTEAEAIHERLEDSFSDVMDLERDNNYVEDIGYKRLELSYSIETSISKFRFSVVYPEIDNDMSALEEAFQDCDNNAAYVD